MSERDTDPRLIRLAREDNVCVAHEILFSTGRGSAVGPAIAPLIKVCASPDTYRRLADETDVDSGRILEGRSEALGHREFIPTDKSFEPIGPACPPLAS
jgi:altronate hydrolase